MWATIGILAALFERTRTGRGGRHLTVRDGACLDEHTFGGLMRQVQN